MHQDAIRRGRSTSASSSEPACRDLVDELLERRIRDTLSGMSTPTIGARLAVARTRTAALRRRIVPANRDALRWDGATLTALRRGQHLLQRQLAERVDTTQSHVSRWEHGQAPSATNVRRLAHALAVDAGELLR
jgi:DNA-binding transcriptional regulator YiaG